MWFAGATENRANAPCYSFWKPLGWWWATFSQNMPSFFDRLMTAEHGFKIPRSSRWVWTWWLRRSGPRNEGLFWSSMTAKGDLDPKVTLKVVFLGNCCQISGTIHHKSTQGNIYVHINVTAVTSLLICCKNTSVTEGWLTEVHISKIWCKTNPIILFLKH